MGKATRIIGRVTHETDSAFVISILAEGGVHVRSLQELRNRTNPPAEAIPALLRALDLVDDQVVKEDIVRALSMREARPAAAARLLRELDTQEADSTYASALGDALAVVSDDPCAEGLLKLAVDARLGRARRGAVEALGRVGDKASVVPVLRALLADDDVVGPALGALRKRGVVLAAAEIAAFLDHPSEDVRMFAGRMQDEFDKALVTSMLAEAGVHVDSVWDVVNSPDPHVDAIPVLLLALDSVHEQSTSVREGIVRSLSVRQARPLAAARLIQEFEAQTGDSSYGWAIGNALAHVTDESYADDLLRLATNPRFGSARQRIVDALGRVGDASVVPVLRQLVADDDVAGPALAALRKRRVVLPAEEITRFLGYPPNTMVHREARKMLSASGDQR
jgi:HEAT repeat protein